MKFLFNKRALDRQWEKELDVFINEMRSVSSKTIDKISKKTIHKHKARLYWMLKENAKIQSLIDSLNTVSSDCDSNDFF